MRIVVHDYCGHPFQAELSRHLAGRGHDVHHLFYADFPGPKALFNVDARSAGKLRFVGLKVGEPVVQTALIRRRFNDLAYGRKAAALIDQIRPDVVLSGNTPTEAQASIIRLCKRNKTHFIYWLQDIYSVAVKTLISRKLPILGKTIGWYYQRLDRQQFRASDAIVVITHDFQPIVAEWSGYTTKIVVIENWGVLADICVGPKQNPWAETQGLTGFAFVYSGTLGRKHSPNLLIRLAEQCAGTDTIMVTVAQGVGVATLHNANIPSLKLLPIQPPDQFANVLATADVLVATIEADAGKFAVPSKVQSYLCAGRAILLAAPPDNLAARLVQRAEAGIVVNPNDENGFLQAAARLQSDAALRERLGRNARAYAERAFDMDRITDKFEHVLCGDGV